MTGIHVKTAVPLEWSEAGVDPSYPLSCEDTDHPFGTPRPVRVNLRDAAVGYRAANECRVHKASGLDVGRVIGRSGHFE